MLVIALSETESGIELRHRPGPAVLQVLFFTPFLLFVIIGFAKVWPHFQNGEGSWLPPLDRLPMSGKLAILSLCFGAGCLIALVALFRAWHTLATGRVWCFDFRQRMITEDGKSIIGFSEIRELLIEGDFRGDTDSLALFVVNASGKRIEVTSGSASERQFTYFVDAARRISERSSLPYRTLALPARGTRAKLPGWWVSVS